MIENKMNEVAKLLGVELEEEFRIDGLARKYKLTENGLKCWFDGFQQWYTSYYIEELLMGKVKIIKLPKSILDDAEKEYLSAVTKPFRDRKVVIKKYEYPQNECIQMSVEYYDKTGGQTVTLPIFKKGTMYKGLESNKCYTLEELGL